MLIKVSVKGSILDGAGRAQGRENWDYAPHNGEGRMTDDSWMLGITL